MSEGESMAHISAALYALDDQAAYLRSLADDLRQTGWTDLAVQPMRARADRIDELAYRLRMAMTPVLIVNKNSEFECLSRGSVQWVKGNRPKE